ncbi:MAG: hypothetical protein ACOY0S_00645 [Patescibacteria group bacterium]
MKFLLAFYGFILFLYALGMLHIPVGAVFLFLLLIGLWLVLFLPKPFVMFLDRLINVPKNVETKQSGFDKGLRVMLILAIQKIHDGFWRFATQYYPFSLLYRDRLFHERNKPIQGFIAELEAYARTINLPFIIRAGDGSEAMALFWAQQTGGKRLKKEEYLQKLQEKLQAKYETIYLRAEANGFTIHVPTSMVKQSQA